MVFILLAAGAARGQGNLNCSDADLLHAAPIANWGFKLRASSAGGIEGGIMPVGRIVQVKKVLAFDGNCRVLAAESETVAQNQPLTRFANLFTVTRTKLDGGGQSVTVPGTQAQSLATSEPGRYRFTAQFNSPDDTIFGLGPISAIVSVREADHALNIEPQKSITQCSQSDFNRRAPISTWNFPLTGTAKVGQVGSMMPVGNLVKLNKVFRHSRDCQVLTANTTKTARQVPLSRFAHLFTVTLQRIDPDSGRVLETKTVSGDKINTLTPNKQGIYLYTASFPPDKALFPLPEIKRRITVVDPRNDRKGKVVTTRIHVGGLTGSGLSFQPGASVVKGGSVVTSDLCGAKTLTAIAKQGRVRAENNGILFTTPVDDKPIPDALWILTRKGSNQVMSKRRSAKFTVAPRSLGDGKYELFLRIPDHHQAPGVQNFKIKLIRVIPIKIIGCGRPTRGGLNEEFTPPDASGERRSTSQIRAGFKTKPKPEEDEDDVDKIFAEIAAEEAAYDALDDPDEVAGGDPAADAPQDKDAPEEEPAEAGDDVPSPDELRAELAAEEDAGLGEEALKKCRELRDEIERMRRLLANDRNCDATRGSLNQLGTLDTTFRSLEQSVTAGHQKIVELRDKLNAKAIGDSVDLEALQAAFDYLRNTAETQQIIKGSRYTPVRPLGAPATYLQLIGDAEDQETAIRELTYLQDELLVLMERRVAAIERELGGSLDNQRKLVDDFFDQLNLIPERERRQLEAQDKYFHPMREVNDLLIQLLVSGDGEDQALLDQLKETREDVFDLFRNGEREHCLSPAPVEGQNAGDIASNIPGLGGGLDLHNFKNKWIDVGDVVQDMIDGLKSGEQDLINKDSIERATVPERLEFEVTAYQPLDEAVRAMRMAVGQAEYGYFDEVGLRVVLGGVVQSIADTITSLAQLHEVPAMLREVIDTEMNKAIDSDPELADFLIDNPSYAAVVRAQIIGAFMAQLPGLISSKLADFLEADLVLDREKLDTAYIFLDDEFISGAGVTIDSRPTAEFAVDALIEGQAALDYLRQQTSAMKNRQEIGSFLLGEALLEFTLGNWAFKAIDELRRFKNVNIIGDGLANVDDVLRAVNAAKDGAGRSSLGSQLFAIGMQTPRHLLKDFIEALGPSGRKALGLPSNASVDDALALFNAQTQRIAQQTAKGGAGSGRLISTQDISAALHAARTAEGGASPQSRLRVLALEAEEAGFLREFVEQLTPAERAALGLPGGSDVNRATRNLQAQIESVKSGPPKQPEPVAKDGGAAVGGKRPAGDRPPAKTDADKELDKFFREQEEQRVKEELARQRAQQQARDAQKQLDEDAGPAKRDDDQQAGPDEQPKAAQDDGQQVAGGDQGDANLPEQGGERPVRGDGGDEPDAPADDGFSAEDRAFFEGRKTTGADDPPTEGGAGSAGNKQRSQAGDGEPQAPSTQDQPPRTAQRPGAGRSPKADGDGSAQAGAGADTPSAAAGSNQAAEGAFNGDAVNGKEFNTGQRLNKGEDGEVVGNTANVYDIDEGHVGKTYRDSIGPDGSLLVDQKRIFQDQFDNAKRLADKDIPHVEVTGKAVVKEVQPDGSIIEKEMLIQKKVVTDVNKGVGFGDQLEKAYGRLPESHQAAFVKLIKQTLDKGEVPLDASVGNVVFDLTDDGKLIAKWAESGNFHDLDKFVGNMLDKKTPASLQEKFGIETGGKSIDSMSRAEKVAAAAKVIEKVADTKNPLATSNALRNAGVDAQDQFLGVSGGIQGRDIDDTFKGALTDPDKDELLDKKIGEFEESLNSAKERTNAESSVEDTPEGAFNLEDEINSALAKDEADAKAEASVEDTPSEGAFSLEDEINNALARDRAQAEAKSPGQGTSQDGSGSGILLDDIERELAKDRAENPGIPQDRSGSQDLLDEDAQPGAPPPSSLPDLNDFTDDASPSPSQPEPGADEITPFGNLQSDGFTLDVEDRINQDQHGFSTSGSANVYMDDKGEFVGKTYRAGGNGSIGAKDFFDDQVENAQRLTDKNIPHLQIEGTGTVNEVQPDGSVVEKDILFQRAVKTNPADGTGLGDELMDEYGGRWPRSHQAAYVKLLKQTLKQGEFPMDPNRGNIVFQRADGGAVEAIWAETGAFKPTEEILQRADDTPEAVAKQEALLGGAVHEKNGLNRLLKRGLESRNQEQGGFAYGEAAGFEDEDFLLGRSFGHSKHLDDDILEELVADGDDKLDDIAANEFTTNPPPRQSPPPPEPDDVEIEPQAPVEDTGPDFDDEFEQDLFGVLAPRPDEWELAA